MKTKILLSILAALLFYACTDKNDISHLPPATQTGAKTFGCLINGELYKCSGYWDSDMIITDEGCGYYTYYDKVVISVKIKNPTRYLDIEFSNPGKTTGIFTEGIVYHTKTALPNTDSKFVITRFDNNILSGTFQFTIEDLNGEIKRFTHGRFDIKNDK